MEQILYFEKLVATYIKRRIFGVCLGASLFGEGKGHLDDPCCSIPELLQSRMEIEGMVHGKYSIV